MESNIIKDLGVVGVNKNGSKYRIVLVECISCKKQWEVRKDTWKKRKTNKCSSCSCWLRKHGKSKNNKLYSRWVSMRERCSENYKLSAYHGVTFVEEWNDFENFEKWALENGYSEELELDKDILCEKYNIEPKIYGPDTCMWITKSQNIKSSNNYLNKRWLEVDSAGIRKVNTKTKGIRYKLVRKGKHLGVFDSMDEAIAYKKKRIL